MVLRTFLVSLLVFGGCGARSARYVHDGGWVASDVGPVRVDIGRTDMLALPDAVTLSAFDLVVADVTLPSSPEEIAQLSDDLDGDGKRDNALGSIFSAIGTFPVLDLSDEARRAIAAGTVVLLMRLLAYERFNSQAAQLWTYLGDPVSCCTQPGNLSACQGEAKKTCFSGVWKFEATPKPFQPHLDGQISSGALDVGPGELPLSLGIFPGSPVELTLKNARVRGRVVNEGVYDGVITGAIPDDQVKSVFVPAFASMIDDVYTSPSTDLATKQAIGLLFDLNSDGHIGSSEVASNSLVKTFLSGDVDVDGDGVREMSFGLGFSAVNATIVL